MLAEPLSFQLQFSRLPAGDRRVQAGLGLGAGRDRAGHRGATRRQGLRLQRSKVLHASCSISSGHQGAVFVEYRENELKFLSSDRFHVSVPQGSDGGSSGTRHSGRGRPDRSSGVCYTLCPVGGVSLKYQIAFWINHERTTS